ncbi:hypothetical protein ACKFKG_11230 [Phormidesmis sp. 146-35]
MKLNRVRTSTLIVGLALIFNATTTPALAARKLTETRSFVYTCGIATCSTYLKRGTTRRLWSKLSKYKGASAGAIGGAAGIACAPIGGVGAAVCGAAGAVYGGLLMDKLEDAATSNKCLRFRHLVGGAVQGIYVDQSGYCKK